MLATHIIGSTHFRCISCAHEQDLLEERAFRCATCGDLLDVHTNYARLSQPFVDGLKDQFDNYAIPGPSPGHRSGVWRFQDLIWPDLQSKEIVTLGEGIVPIVPAGRALTDWVGGELDLHAILEGGNPSGSFKDQGMTAMVTLAKLAGARAISVASTGDTSAAAAAYAAAAGIKCVALLPAGKVSHSQLVQPVAYGARIIEVPGDFDDCMRIQAGLIKLGSYPGNSLNSMRIAGHMSTAFLLAQYFRWELPDWIAAPVGNGSNSTSIGMGMRRLVELGLVKTTGRILGCQTEMANPLARSWHGNDEQEWRRVYKPVKAGDTIATATQIGSPVSHSKVMREVTLSNGAMQTVTEADIREAMEVCNRAGLPVCPQTGIAVAGLRDAVHNKVVQPGARVAFVSTAHALKFTHLFDASAAKAVERAPDTSIASVARMIGL